MSDLRSPIPYFGSKHRIAPQIVAMLDVPHEHYIEPFAGSLSILFAKPPRPLETINDLDMNITTFWRVLRDRESELLRVCALTPHSRNELARARDMSDNPDDLERARRVWVQLTQGRSSQLDGATGWNHNKSLTTSPHVSMASYLDTYRLRLEPAAQRLRRVQLECRPALDVVTNYGGDPAALLYCDPPYTGDVRGHGGYAQDMDEHDHVLLAAALHRSRAKVAISGYRSPLYDDLFHTWTRIDIPAYTQQGATGQTPCNRRTESLWINYQPPQPTLWEF